MKKILFALPLLLLPIGASAAVYPDIPDAGREHYIIYREGYRDDRVELAQFDLGGEDELVISDNVLSAKNEGEYKNSIKYYLENNEWIAFEEGYERVSNNASELIQSDIDVKTEFGKTRLYGQNEDGTLRSYSELTKNSSGITLSYISTDSGTWDMLTKCPIIDNNRAGVSWLKAEYLSRNTSNEDLSAETGHFIDVENDPYPDEQRRYEYKDGYAVIPTYSKEVYYDLANKDAPLPQLDRKADYENIYLTDRENNITGIIRADSSAYNNGSWGYFICVDSLKKIGGELFAAYKVMRKASTSDFNEYRTDVVGMYHIADDKLETPKYEQLMSPDGRMVFADLRGGSDSSYHNTYAFINGKTYRMVSNNIDYRRGFFKMIGDYFVLPDISNAREVDPRYDAGNHNIGIIRELYLSKDYVNFACLPLKAELRDSGTTITGCSQLDDQYYVYYNSGYWRAGDVQERPVQIFSKSMIDDMVQSMPDPVYVAFRDSLISFDTPPQIIDGRTMIPVRLLFETMGARVNWDDTAKTAIITRGASQIEITAGSDTALVDGEERQMDVGAQIIDGRTLVPLRFLSESLGYSVGWDDAYRLVTIE